MAALILISTAIDYGVGRAAERNESRQTACVSSDELAGNLGLLGFKYLDFTLTNLNSLGQASSGSALSSQPFNVPLPVGISFYNFSPLATPLMCVSWGADPRASLRTICCLRCVLPAVDR